MKLKTLAGALLVGAFFVSHAKAGNNTAGVQAAANGGKAVYGTGVPVPKISPTVYLPGGVSGETLMRDLLKMPGPGAKTLDVQVARKIPWGTVARGLARASPWVTGAAIAWEIWQSVRARPDGSGGVELDPGQSDQQATTYCVSGTEDCGATPEAAYAVHVGVFARQMYLSWGANASSYVVQGTAICDAGGNCTGLRAVVFMVAAAGGGSNIYSRNAYVVSKTVRMCPAIPGNPAPAVGRDGKCPTGVYQPSTQEEVGSKIESYGDKSKARDAVEELIEKDVDLQPKPLITVTGQPSVQSEPRTRTETAPDGSTRTTTERDVWNITYNGDSYTWNQTTITTNPDGSTTEESDPEPDKVTPPTDPDMPDLPELYKRKYPDGLSGVWHAESGAFRQTPIFQFLGSLNPNLGNGGCPVWGFPAGNVLGIAVGGDISVPCYVWSFLRVLFVISALLLSRRLIFGG